MKKIILSAIAGGMTLMAFGAEPVPTLQGAGTADNPWLITSVEDLTWLSTACSDATTSNRGHYKGQFFKLTADLDMSGITDFYGIGAAKITAGNSATGYYFSGTFDGDGHRIKNLVINGVTFDTNGVVQTAAANKSRQYVGFFGSLYMGGCVKNLIIDSSCSISGYGYVGGITGYAAAGSVIENCVNEANIDCYNTYGGGILATCAQTTVGGDDSMKIINCYNSGTIRVAGYYGGGIAGNIGGGEIYTSINVGEVRVDSFHAGKAQGAGYNAGGIAGAAGSLVQDCLNAGTVYASSYACGGIIGTATGKDEAFCVKNCVSYGAVIGGDSGQRGPFIGMNGSAGSSIYSADNCYYDSQLMAPFISGMPSGGGGFTKGYFGKTTAELTSGTPLAGLGDEWVFTAGYYPMLKNWQTDIAKAAAACYITLPSGMTSENFTGVATVSSAMSGITVKASPSSWLTVSGANVNSSKTDVCQIDTVCMTNGSYTRVFPFAQIQIPFQGEGTEANPYILANKNDIIALANLTNDRYPVRFPDRYFKITADIDMEKDTVFHGIASRGAVSNVYRTYYFAGHIDGDNHTISNIKYDNVVFDESGKALAATGGSYSYAGFVGTLASFGSIRNLHLDASCEINGYQRVGSLVGFANQGALISDCSSAATVKGYYTEVAGLVGYMCGFSTPCILRNSLFSGSVWSNRDVVAGLVAYQRGGIENCVNIGSVTAECFSGAPSSATVYKNAGGIAAHNYGYIRDCANYGNVKGALNVGGIVASYSSTYDNGAIQRCFNSGVVISELDSIAGSVAGTPAAATTVPHLSSVYFDSQLTCYDAVKGEGIEGCTGMLTSVLTSGTPVDSLAGTYTFVNGYYPIPTSFADNALVKAAAATFFTLPSSETIRDITTFGIINTIMPIEASLSDATSFVIKDGTVQALSATEAAADLTLTNGSFSIIYPLHTSGSLMGGVETIAGDMADPVVKTTYYSTDGLRLTSPVRGTMAIEETVTESGRRTVRKVVVR